MFFHYSLVRYHNFARVLLAFQAQGFLILSHLSIESPADKNQSRIVSPKMQEMIIPVNSELFDRVQNVYVKRELKKFFLFVILNLGLDKLKTMCIIVASVRCR